MSGRRQLVLERQSKALGRASSLAAVCAAEREIRRGILRLRSAEYAHAQSPGDVLLDVYREAREMLEAIADVASEARISYAGDRSARTSMAMEGLITECSEERERREA